MQSTQSIQRFRYRLSPVRLKGGLWLIVFLFAVMIGAAALASDDFPAELGQALRSIPAWAGVLAIVAVAALAFLATRMVQMARDAWLIADGDGIRCSPHRHHGPRAWLRCDWELPWSDIERAEVQRPGPGARQAQSWFYTTLTLASARGDYRLGLLQWDPVDEPLDRPDLMAFRPGRKLHALTESHPLIGHLESRGIEVEYRRMGLRDLLALGRPGADRPVADDGDAPVDLMAHPPLVAMLALMVVLATAAVLHFTLLPPIRPLWSPHLAAVLLIGTLVFAASALLARSAPVRERTIVALLLGGLVAGLWHPLSVRVQSMLGEQAETVIYHASESGRFRPADAAFPELDLSDLDIPEYWDSLTPGSSHPFELQPVGDGDYILHLDSLFERTRLFYGATESD